MLAIYFENGNIQDSPTVSFATTGVSSAANAALYCTYTKPVKNSIYESWNAGSVVIFTYMAAVGSAPARWVMTNFQDLSDYEPLIVGTQSAATGSWAGTAPFAELHHGQKILYWLPYNGSGNATLNLTLSTGSTTGAKNIYHSGTTRVSTQFLAGSIIRLVYLVNANVGGTNTTGWWVESHAKADGLTTARTIGLSGGATGTATSFDGTANITIPVTALDASKISSGTININRLPDLYWANVKVSGASSVLAEPTLKTLTIGSTDAANHINFSRANYNYLNVPTGGSLAVSVNGAQGTNIRLAVNDTSVHSYTTNSVTLGTSSIRWKALYVGTADSYGSSKAPIYWDNGVPTQVNLKDTTNNFINSLDIGSNVPGDADYFISQYVGGGSSTTTYYRRQMSKLWEYIQGKIANYPVSSTWSLTGGTSFGQDGLDLNSYTTPGNYYCNTDARAQTVLHNPWADGASASMKAFQLKVSAASGSGTTRLRQELLLSDSLQRFVRISTDGGSTWGAWGIITYKTSGPSTAVGSSKKPVYVTTSGEIVAISDSVGTTDIPVYVNNGQFTAVNQPASGSWFKGVPHVASDGVIELGRYIDFHPTNATTLNYGVRLDSGDSTTQRVFTFGSAAGELVTHTANTAIGSSTQPVYVKADGSVAAAGAYSGLFTDLSWTDGNAGGPVLNATIGGTSKTATIPAATGNKSGIITTGIQTFAGNKTFTGDIAAENISTKNITATGNLTLTGNANLNGNTYAEGITAGTLLVNGNSSFVNDVAFTKIPTAPTAAAGTNNTQLATTAFVMNAFTANDAMVFKGVVNSASGLPATHYQGWTYKVGTAGSYVGTYCEVGDLIICVTDGTSANNAHWAVIQNNVDGAVFMGHGGSAIGSATQPVYVKSNGEVTAGTALKALAYKDSISYTPAGTISNTSITPAGTNAASAVTISPKTTSVYSMSSDGSVTAGTAASLTMSVDNEVLSFSWTTNTPTAVTLPGRTQVTGLWNGYNTGVSNTYAAAQTFTGTAASHNHTFTGTAATLS